jgi:hypothetical protein
MASLKVRMVWVPQKYMWVMDEVGGNTIQEFFNCGKMEQYFEGLDKKIPQQYSITITKES